MYEEAFRPDKILKTHKIIHTSPYISVKYRKLSPDKTYIMHAARNSPMLNFHYVIITHNLGLTRHKI